MPSVHHATWHETYQTGCALWQNNQWESCAEPQTLSIHPNVVRLVQLHAQLQATLVLHSR